MITKPFLIKRVTYVRFFIITMNIFDVCKRTRFGILQQFDMRSTVTVCGHDAEI